MKPYWSKMLFFALASALLVGFLVGCSTNADVGTVVEDFFREINRGNLESAKSKFLARPLISKIESPLLGGQNYLRDTFDGWRNRITRVFLENEEVAGEAAIVTAVIGNASGGNWVGDISLVKQDGRVWKINGLEQFEEFNLAQGTRSLLRDLHRDVCIYVFDRQRRRIGELANPSGVRQGHHLADVFPANSSHVTVKYIDADRQADLTNQFGIRNDGTIIVSAGDRRVEAKGTTEEAITNAVVRVLKNSQTACFITGHSERSTDSTDRDGYDKFKAQLGNENYQTPMLRIGQETEVSSDCTIVVIAGPQSDFLPPEIESVKHFLHNGGRVLAMLDAGVELSNLTRLVGSWGVKARNDLVIDENHIAKIFGTEPYMPLIVKYGTSTIVEPLKGHAILFPLSRSFEVSQDPNAGIIKNDSLGETSTESYDVPNWTPKMRQIRFEPGKDLKGPLTVAVAGTVSGGADKKPGRFVVLGTSLVPANAYLNFQSNRDFIMNCVDWLSAEQ